MVLAYVRSWSVLTPLRVLKLIRKISHSSEPTRGTGSPPSAMRMATGFTDAYVLVILSQRLRLSAACVQRRMMRLVSITR